MKKSRRTLKIKPRYYPFVRTINIKTAIIALILTFYIQGCSPNQGDSKGINWKTYDEAVSIGKTKGKKIFLNFYANWCPFCKRMDNNTFADSKVIEYLEKNFVSAKVNTDKKSETATYYKVSSLPTLLFLTEKGEQIDSLKGYIPPNMFIKYLEYIKTESYLNNGSFKDFVLKSEQ